MRSEEKRRKLVEKKKEINKKFNEEYNNLIKKKIDEVEINFMRYKDLFCMEEIKKYDLKKIDNLIKNIFRVEMLVLKINEVLNNLIEKSGKNNINVEHLNIILVGPSGVGKSTLINSILEFDEINQIQTGYGEPITKGEPKFYSSEKIKFLRITDSRGIERTIEFGVSSIYN